MRIVHLENGGRKNFGAMSVTTVVLGNIKINGICKGVAKIVVVVNIKTPMDSQHAIRAKLVSIKTLTVKVIANIVLLVTSRTKLYKLVVNLVRKVGLNRQIMVLVVMSAPLVVIKQQT